MQRAMNVEQDSPADDGVMIVGAGIAGSLLALVLGRKGHRVTVFDPQRQPAQVFRNEKLGHEQIALLTKLGVLDCFKAGCWPEPSHPHAYPEDARPSLVDCGAHHHVWLSAVRDAWPANVRFVEDVVARVETSPEQQMVETRSGERFTDRLVVVASGRMTQLDEGLGITRRSLSPGHSVCLGFSVAPDQPIPAEVIEATHGTGIGYVSVFPMPGETRVNVFSYRALTDPWTRRMSKDPLGALAEMAPAAAKLLDGVKVVRRCEVRGTDLYETDGHIQPGLLLIGDAYHAPCPASGTGMLRILNDIDVLVSRHLDDWMATPGMGGGKILGFYTDPLKRNLDNSSLRSSYRNRGRVVGTGLKWEIYRLLRQIKAMIRPPVQTAASTS